MTNRRQRVVIIGIESDWREIKAGVPQGSVLGPLLFLIYINDLCENIGSEMRLFADDSSLFSCVKGTNQTRNKIVNDLRCVEDWGYQWKMVFYPTVAKQAVERLFFLVKIKRLNIQS